VASSFRTPGCAPGAGSSKPAHESLAQSPPPRDNPPVDARASRATRVSLLRWLRRQLRQPEPLRERLEAAIENDDPAEARLIVARFEFSEAQRRHVDGLIDEWQRELGAPDDLEAPGAP
jgi:hypothetical protein